MTTAEQIDALKGLLTRVSQARGSDRRLDYELFRAFASNDASNIWDPKVGHFFTASVDEALSLLHRALPEHDWILGHTNGGLTIHCQVGRTKEAFGETPALAVCAGLVAEKLFLLTHEASHEGA